MGECLAGTERAKYFLAEDSNAEHEEAAGR